MRPSKILIILAYGFKQQVKGVRGNRKPADFIYGVITNTQTPESLANIYGRSAMPIHAPHPSTFPSTALTSSSFFGTGLIAFLSSGSPSAITW